jgi:N6-adenosine-specific RNA methylase IME4
VKYSVLSADPPWSLKDRGSRLAPSHEGTGRKGDRVYDVMSTSEICAAGPLVQSLSKDDAFLFLWAPHALVLDGTATKVARAWGFEPKQEIVWIKTTLDGKKPRIGGGHYTRLCTEPLLLCRRGRAKVVRKDVPNVIFAPRGAHSAKRPDAGGSGVRLLSECCVGALIGLCAAFWLWGGN